MRLYENRDLKFAIMNSGMELENCNTKGHELDIAIFFQSFLGFFSLNYGLKSQFVLVYWSSCKLCSGCTDIILVLSTCDVLVPIMSWISLLSRIGMQFLNPCSEQRFVGGNNNWN